MAQTNTLALATRFLATICLTTVVSVCPLPGQDDITASIRGIVQNERGEPVRHARVDISTAAPKSGPAVFCPTCYLDCQKWTTTDESGQFKITDLDSRLNFRLVVSAVGFKTAQTELLAPGGDSHEVTLRDRPKTIDFLRTVRGEVKNEAGIVVQGAIVSPAMTIDKDGLRSSSGRGVHPAVTDANGYFEIDLVDGVYGIDIEIAAEGLCNRIFIDLKPTDALKTFELLEGARILGRVYDKGHPASGMTISVAQIDRGFRGEQFFQQAIPTVTDTQGQFELKNLLPDQEYCIYSVVGEADRGTSALIIETQKFIAPSSGRFLDIGKLTTVPSVSIGGRLIRRDGEPIDNVTLLFNRDPAWDMIKIPVASDGTFRIDGLPPEVYEITLASGQFDLDADKIDSLLWAEKSIKRLIDKSINDFVLPIRKTERGESGVERTDTQVLNGRVTLPGGKGAAGIIVSANDGNSPKTSTSDVGSFTLEFPASTDWLKLYRPDPDGMRFWYMGRFKPKLGKNDVNIQLGPETTHVPDTLAAQR